MPHFYFHLYNDIEARDPEGRNLASLACAKNVALHEARTMMAEAVMNGRVNLSHRVEVADESDKMLAVVAFRDAVEIEG